MSKPPRVEQLGLQRELSSRPSITLSRSQNLPRCGANIGLERDCRRFDWIIAQIREPTTSNRVYRLHLTAETPSQAYLGISAASNELIDVLTSALLNGNFSGTIMATSTARIVHKDQYNQQFLFDVPHSALPPLKDSWIRIQLRMLTISSVNLSYCTLGKIASWWDAYPLPPSLPTPYNDASQYGIAPGWGFSEVMESRNPEIPVGTTLYGLMPTSAYPVDLYLNPANVPGHWIEVSERRKKLMPLYQRFKVQNGALGPKHEMNSAIMITSQMIFEAGYVLNRFVFASLPGDQPTHPFPELKQPWSKEDSDLKDAVVIASASGGKTCKTFVHQLATNRAAGSGPKALIEITSTRSSILDGVKLSFAHRVFTYDEALSTDLIKSVMASNPKRIVLLDFGARDNIGDSLGEHLENSIPGIKVDVVGIGREAKFNLDTVVSTRLGGTRMNTSGIRVEAVKQLGEARYFQQLDEASENMVKTELERVSGTRAEGQVLGVQIIWGEGMRGSGGVEQAWIDLCAGRLHGSRGYVFRFPHTTRSPRM